MFKSKSLRGSQILSLICPLITLATLLIKLEHSNACTVLLGCRLYEYDYTTPKVVELTQTDTRKRVSLTTSKTREDFTLQLLEKFKTKLHAIKEKVETEGAPSEKTGEENDEDLNTDNWLGHTLQFEEKGAVLAKDASTKGDDWFDIYDPRNPINKRKREKSDKKQKK